MSQPHRKVAIITGASHGIGAGLTSAFRRAGYSVVGTALSIPDAHEPDFLAVPGDITESATALRVVEQALRAHDKISEGVVSWV
jgi:NAD(P)-dependent dehydrogenase (short-subunit alcohol dehydrogenase family)